MRRVRTAWENGRNGEVWNLSEQPTSPPILHKESSPPSHIPKLESMTYTLISAAPSPYARKVRIALNEKRIPFELKTEVPWDSTSETPHYNPLEKLPVLIPDDGGNAVYESHYIMDWLEIKHPEPSLMPDSIEGKLKAKQVEVVADGVCDALVIAFFENMREESKQSQPWKARSVLHQMPQFLQN